MLWVVNVARMSWRYHSMDVGERSTITLFRAVLVAFVFLATSLAIRAAHTQEPTAASTTVPISTTVTVFGHKSAETPPITMHDVTVYSGKSRLDVTGWVRVQDQDQGLQLAIVIDNSASAIGVGSQLRDLADFIRSQPKNTAVGVFYAQSGTVETVSPFSTDHDAVARTLRVPLGARAGTSPSVYLSISDLVKHHWVPTGGAREILLISAGVDHLNEGPNSPYVQATIEDLQKAGVVIHTIYTGGRLSFDESIRGENAQGNLAKITDASGGRGFFEGITAPVSFDPYLQELNTILHNQYLLTFSMAPSNKRKGELREIEVHAEQHDVTLKYPKQVLVPGLVD
jgi:hypothetical protein